MYPFVCILATSSVTIRNSIFLKCSRRFRAVGSVKFWYWDAMIRPFTPRCSRSLRVFNKTVTPLLVINATEIINSSHLVSSTTNDVKIFSPRSKSLISNLGLYSSSARMEESKKPYFIPFFSSTQQSVLSLQHQFFHDRLIRGRPIQFIEILAL